MSHVPNESDSLFSALSRWFTPSRRRQLNTEESAPRQATVEYLEIRQLLSATNTAAAPEQVANQAGTTTSTTVTHGVDENGNATTTTTITTTTTDENGNTTTTTSSTTTVDSESETTPQSVDTDQALASAVQSDGKIILVGTAQINTSGDYDFAVTRLNADGTLDTTFGDNGKKVVSFNLASNGLDVATCVAIQADGKIVVGGYAQRNSSGNFDFAVIRLLENGDLDTSFSGDGKATVAFDYGGSGDDRATGIAVQSDGKIVIVGYCQKVSLGDNDFGVARLNSDGSLDTSFTGDGRKFIGFNANGKADDRAAAVVIQPDGGIVIVGYAQATGTGNDDFAITRLTPNGSLDRSFSADGKKTVAFNIGGTGTDRASSVALQSDGGILVGGSATATLGDGDFAVARIKKNGSMDKSFSGDGRKTIAFNMGGSNEDQVSGIAVQSDGSIVIGGFTQMSAGGDFDMAAARLTANGELDPTFSSDGKKTVSFNVGGSDHDMANGLVLLPDGKLLLVGHALKSDPANTDFAMAKLDTDGQLDASFGNGGIKTIPFDLT